MKVVLLKDVPKIGQKNDIKEISDGYANNFLLPRKLAVIATPTTINQIEKAKEISITENKTRKELLLKNLKELSGTTITLAGKVNDQGHLFAGIHKEEIVTELKKASSLEIESDSIQLDKPIKEIGEHEIEVKIGDSSSKFKLIIEEEN